MGLTSDVIERLPHVEGILNYLAPMADEPMNWPTTRRPAWRARPASPSRIG